MSFTAELPHLSFLHASLHCATEIRPSGPVFAQLAGKRQQESERETGNQTNVTLIVEAFGHLLVSF